ncbi:hypothetical protein [Aquisphaera insulae]|uniref:hypothetical protein n=1 Tax=Aquisphaera insulae TaxID=2712864 RepID=UPI0013EAE476|nr:hypothetical protein [Aquisphaera insulae]
MALVTCLCCPHCKKDIRTKKIITPGALVRCPGCENNFRIAPSLSGDHQILEEIIPVTPRFPVVDIAEASPRPLPPAMSPAPSGGFMRRSMEQLPYESRARYKEPFGHSRSIFATMGVSCLALMGYGFGSWYCDKVVELDNTIVKAAPARGKKLDPDAVAKAEKSKKTAPPVADVPPQEDPANVRTLAPGTVMIGKLRVGVAEAMIGSLNLPSGKAIECLALTVQVMNEGGTPFAYNGWTDKPGAILRNKLGYRFNRISLRADDSPPGRYGGGPIDPNTSATDLIVFDKPKIVKESAAMNSPDNELELDLPIGSQAFKFRIPWTFLKPTNTVLDTRPRVETQVIVPPPPKEPFNPESDSSIRTAIRREYDSGMRNIRHAMKGMSTNHASEYRREAERDLLTKLVKDYSEYKLTRQQITRILKDIPTPPRKN